MHPNNTIQTNYTDAQLRVLVEEYITQQPRAVTLQGACGYVLYWAMEDGRTTASGPYQSQRLSPADCQRVSHVLQVIAEEGRIEAEGELYQKVMN